MAATVVIPARYGSTRFPAKILASETGKPLVQHVVDRVRRCALVSRIVVATDDARIVDALRPFGTTCVMTSPSHQSGTDRVAEVALDLDEADARIVVNVQGDEPEIDPATVDGLITRLLESDDDMATASTPYPANADPGDPNLVKVVTAADGRAVYFSRSPIPFHRDWPADRPRAYDLHLGIYAYRRAFLLSFASWPPTPLEKIEKLEQLRALEHGRRIFVLKVKHSAHGIDTPEQYAEFVKREKSGRSRQ